MKDIVSAKKAVGQTIDIEPILSTLVQNFKIFLLFENNYGFPTKEWQNY
ncbi:MAG: hypothetical protein ABSC53_08800 [Bacteroidota bacterium]